MIKKTPKLITILFLLIFFKGVSYGQLENINALPYTYNDINFSNSDFNLLKGLSDNFRGKRKIETFGPSGPDYSATEYWPLGSWGNGYYSLSAEINEYNLAHSDYDTYYNGYVSGGSIEYFSSHPLIRTTSDFLRGHIQAYIATGDNDHLDFAKEGIDYLLDEQHGSGGYMYWKNRADQNICSDGADEEINVIHIYPTSHGLRSLCEFALISDYRETEVLDAINSAAGYLLENTDETGNYNYLSLVAWGLAGAYKVTLNCDYRDYAFSLADLIMVGQTKTGIAIGSWNNNQLDGDAPDEYYHDTKIFYHTMILRGLIEVMDITPQYLPERRLDVVNTIKKGVNHIIDTRLRCNDGPTDESTIPNLRRLWVFASGAEVPAFYNWDLNGIGLPQIYEPIAMLLVYSNFHSEFSPSDQSNLRNLLNYMALNIEGNKDKLYFFTAMGYYKTFLNAYLTNTLVFDWSGADFHYDVNEITNNTVSGDFDNDGQEDDVAAFYYYGLGETRIHSWTGKSEYFDYNGAESWWNSSPLYGWYDVNKISDRIVSGDFDGDGYKDDIAAFYDYGVGGTKIHVWLSDGTKFIYQGGDGFWDETGYNASLITGRVISGDFDDDGKDDIAAIYDYGAGETRIHVWKSNGIEFVYQGASGFWNMVGYNADNTTGRVVSGDFNDDGKDDVAAMYDYGSSETRIHVWLSNGGAFIYQYSTGWWQSTGYDSDNVDSRVVSGDFNNDGKDDVAAMYDYGSGGTRTHVWLSTGGAFNYQSSYGWWDNLGYNANLVNGRFLAGDFIPGGGIDLCAFYDYGNETGHMHVWESTNSAFVYQDTRGWWHKCDLAEQEAQRNNRAPLITHNSQEAGPDLIELTNPLDQMIPNVYPNPTSGNLTLFINDYTSEKKCEIKLFTMDGRLVLEREITAANTILDISELKSGTYLTQVINAGQFYQLKVVKN